MKKLTESFAVLAKEAFTFLGDEFGFAPSEGFGSGVQYSGNGVAVRIGFDPRSGEIEVEVAPNGTQDWYSVWEISRANADPDVRVETTVYATTALEIADGLERVAAVLRRNGGRILKGDLSTWPSLRMQRIAESRSFTKAGETAYIREQAQAAWEKKDFAMVVTLLERIEPPLSVSDKRRLMQAKKALT